MTTEKRKWSSVIFSYHTPVLLVPVDEQLLLPFGYMAGIVNLLGPHTVCQSCRMNTPPATTKYKNHRFPVEIISHAVWLYLRFCLSFRDVEEILLERGVVVTYEATRTDGSRFRNTEVLTFEGDKISRAEVYFGWDLDEALMPLG